jgi:hypothetical protein
MAVTDRLYPTHRIKDPARTELGKNGMSSAVETKFCGTVSVSLGLQIRCFSLAMEGHFALKTPFCSPKSTRTSTTKLSFDSTSGVADSSIQDIIKIAWFAKVRWLFCINTASKMLANARHRLRFSPWIDTK